MQQTKPKIAILATGGTIAGSIDNAIATTQYTAGVLNIDTLLQALPQIRELADITSFQIANIDSANLTDVILLTLAKTINTLLANDFDGVVVTHGTDTLEESAYFLNLTTKSNQPIVLVGAMRPSTAISADGPKNLYNAIALAANRNARGMGVMVVMNDKILSARGAVKTHSLNMDGFSSPNFGDLGYIIDGKAFFYYSKIRKESFFDTNTLNALPKVDILYTYCNDGSAVAAKAFVEDGAKGLVIAGSGAGSIHQNQKAILKQLLKQGINIVISSRVFAGRVILNDLDKALGFIGAEDLNPQKARILLALALTKTNHPKTIAKYFSIH